jgi:thiol-disulfide isomerase/thioredoxin
MGWARRFGRAVLVLAVGWTAAIAPTPAQAPAEDRITVQPLSYADLGKLVRGLKGKVVVVDFWADFCPPCKREFPHLVELHRKYARDGFVAVSVSLDNPEDAGVRASVERFLTRQQAHFTNVILQARPEEWQKKLNIDGPPCVYVFDRDNRSVQKLVGDDQINYQRIEEEVVKLLGR